MKIEVITHVDFESPGEISHWAESRGHELVPLKPYCGDILPEEFKSDGLIIMGGPQSTSERNKYTYLKEEITYIDRAKDKNVPIIGICLGAQLIGCSFGVESEKSPEKEIGVYPIALTNEGLQDCALKNCLNEFDVVHWHGEMPGLPTNAQALAKSKGCPRQIIRFGEKVLGFQCHPELTHQGVTDLIEACPEDLSPGKFIRSKAEMLEYDYTKIKPTLFTIFDNIFQT